MSFLAELRRRNVLRVAAAYVFGAWLVIQVAETIFPLFGMEHTPRIVVIVLAVGFIPALIFAWVFELTPAGIRKESSVDSSQSISLQTGKRLDRVIMLVLALALAYFAFDKFVLADYRETLIAERAREAGRTEALVESFGDRSIAVLPFADMSPAGDQEYFADGMSEELLNLLAKIPQIRVISRSSAFSFKGKDVKVADIARDLDVDHVLEGSVRMSGDRVRITAQLIEARSDTHLWSQTYDRRLDDIFDTQDEIAAMVVENLKVKLLGNAPRAVKTDPEAYNLFLQAQHLHGLYSPESMEAAVELYQQALEIAPNYPAAWNGLAAVYVSQSRAGSRPRDEGFRLARDAANRALGIDPDYARAHDTLGAIAAVHYNDQAAAMRHYQRALEIEPNNAAILDHAAISALALGRIDTAIAIGEYSVAREPLRPASRANLAARYLYAGRFDEAIATYHTALSLSPDFYSLHYYLGLALLLNGEHDAALAAVQQEKAELFRLQGEAMVYHTMKRQQDYERVLAAFRVEWGEQAPVHLAAVYAWAGEADAAFEALERAIAGGTHNVMWVHLMPFYHPLHDDPRWQPFMERAGTSDEQLAAIELGIEVPQ